MEFNELFFKESSELGYGVEGLKVLNLLEGDLRLGMVDIKNSQENEVCLALQ